MKITNIDLYHVVMPLTEPWVTAYGYQSEIESVFVNLRSDDLSGWGECAPAPMPFYNSEYTAGSFFLARDCLGPKIFGEEISSPTDLSVLLSAFKGNEFAKSAFDAAWWDLYARSLKTPLWQLIGGENPDIKVGADIPVQNNANDLVDRAAKAVEDGHDRIKFKFNRQCSYEMMAAVREAFPDLVMHIDCNSGFSLDDIELFRKLDSLRLSMIEQPLAFDDLINHSKLQKEISTPICLDESITSVDRAFKAIGIQACGWINIKTSRVGGLTNAIAIEELCTHHNLPI